MFDTSAYSWLRAGHTQVVDLVASADLVSVPTVALGEIEAGFHLGSRRAANRALLEEFLAEPFVSILPVTRSVSRRYGRLFSLLKRAGTPIPINDVWIAATALDTGATLLTFDGHFKQVPSLDLTLLPS